MTTFDGTDGDDEIEVEVNTGAGQVTQVSAGAGIDNVYFDDAGAGSAVVHLGTGIDTIRVINSPAGGMEVYFGADTDPGTGEGDTLSFADIHFYPGMGTSLGTITVYDFDAKQGPFLEDVISVTDLFVSLGLRWGYHTGLNPFDLGFLSLVQVGSDVHLLADLNNDEVMDSTPLVILADVQLGELGIANFGLSFGTLGLAPGQVVNDDDLPHILAGTPGPDTINGGGGNDQINGMSGNDLLTGGAGADIFAFSANFLSAEGARTDHDTITDFSVAEDKLDLSKFGFRFFDDILARARQVGADVVIDLALHETVTLKSVSLGALTAANFVGLLDGAPLIELPSGMPQSSTFAYSSYSGPGSVTIDAGTTQTALYSNGLYATDSFGVGNYFGLTNNGTLWVHALGWGSALEGGRWDAIVNNGDMIVTADSNAAHVVNADSAWAGVVNHGTMLAISLIDTATGVEDYDFQDKIENYGTIAARGVYVTTIQRNNGGQVINYQAGEILAEGDNATAIYIGGVSNRFITDPAQLINEGLILARSLDPDSPSFGVVIDGFELFFNSIQNSGFIGADIAYLAITTGSNTVNAQGIFNNLAGAKVHGAMLFGNNIDQLTNAGLIAGDVYLDFGNDSFDGSAGIQTGWIDGGAGNDTLHGGAGDDLFEGGDGDDLLNGGGGFDTASYFTSGSAVTVDLALTGAQATGQGSDTLIDIEDLLGSEFNDTLLGNDAGNWIDGGAGDDHLEGRSGDDFYFIDSLGDVVVELPGQGIDTLFTPFSTYIDVFPNLENLVLGGTDNLYGVGNAQANAIFGNGGSNLLIGGDGSDTLHGDAGGDSLFGEAGNDELFGDAGIDYLVGGAGDDVLDGGADTDALYGEDGNDVLTGGEGFVTDILVGGAGNDVLFANSGMNDYDLIDGGSGDDLYYVDTGDDLTFEAIGGGTDTVYANVSNVPNAGVYLYANVENLVLIGTTAFGVGNELDNQLTGSASANWLLGGAGNDRIDGKAGNDVLFGEAGSDTFVFGTGSGGDVIGDFVHGADRIDVDAYNFTSFSDLASHFVQVGSDGAIDLGGGNIVVLLGVTMANLDSGDFIL